MVNARIAGAVLALVVACGRSSKNEDPGGSGPADKLTALRSSAENVIDELGKFESARDVTCWTSFRQLDWYIAEKSYSEFGTLAKINAMKVLVRAVWDKASSAAKGPQVTAADIEGAVKLPKIALPSQQQAKLTTFANDIGIKNFTDYQKTAEHMRIVLSAIQDVMYSTGGNPPVKPLDASGSKALGDAATTLSLMMLKESAKAADAEESRLIEGAHVQTAFKKITADTGLKNEPTPRAPLDPTLVVAQLQPITKKLIDNKVEALNKFNKGTGQLTADLNKVTRTPLTDDGVNAMLRDAQSFVHFVAAGYEPMQADNYLSDGSFARSKLARRAYVDEVWAQNVVMQLFPHEMMPNGDVLVRYEPNPGPVTDAPVQAFEVKMLGHEMDGVRDSAIHWVALQNVWKETPFAMDPFAAEYTSEVVSMMVTLWIRRGEVIAAQLGKKQIDADVVKRIRDRAYVMVRPVEGPSAAWTAERQKQKQTLLASITVPLFRDTSKTAGLPTKFERFGTDLTHLAGPPDPDTKDVPGHVAPDKDLKGTPGHVAPDKDLKGTPGHVAPDKDLKGTPGHVAPDKDLKGTPGHVAPDKDLKGTPGHVAPDKDLKGTPGHVAPDKDLKGTSGHVAPDKDLKGTPGHVAPDKDLKGTPGHVAPDKDLKGTPGHVAPDKDLKGTPGHVAPDKDLKGAPGHVAPDKDLKGTPGHVAPDKDLKGTPGHVAPDKDSKDVKGHVEPDATSVQGHFNLQTIMGGGIAVGDLNGDEYPDLYLTGEELGKLYINRGKAGPGTFVDATAQWGLPEIKDGHGTLFFDYDGDGDLDLLVLRSEHPSALFRNDKGKFVDVAAELGIKTHRGAHVAHVFDYDGDGDLDIYIGYYGSHDANMNAGARSVPSLDGRNGSPHQLWRNDGDHFTEVAQAAGVADIGWTLAVTSFDYNNDGYPDLFLANDFGADVFYENKGDGTFKDITVPTGTGDRGSGMNAEVADINGDGKWDIYVTNIDMFSKNIKVIFPRDESTINVDESLTRAFQYLSGNKLYVSTPTGFRPEENARFEPHDRGWGWDASFFDWDNDGDDDLYVTNGWINGSYAGNQKKQFYLNDQGFFYLAPQASDEAYAGNARSAAAVDLDLDGKVDLVVNNFRQPPRVLINNANTKNNFVQLRLAGKGKNPFALGAQVTIKANGKTILRQVAGGRGYLSQADTLISAGVGDAKTVDVEIRWPDRTKSTATGLAVGKRHVIKE